MDDKYWNFLNFTTSHMDDAACWGRYQRHRWGTNSVRKVKAGKEAGQIIELFWESLMYDIEVVEEGAFGVLRSVGYGPELRRFCSA